MLVPALQELSYLKPSCSDPLDTFLHANELTICNLARDFQTKHVSPGVKGKKT